MGGRDPTNVDTYEQQRRSCVVMVQTTRKISTSITTSVATMPATGKARRHD